jgi:hypothetical protein
MMLPGVYGKEIYPKSVIPVCFKPWFDPVHHRRVRNWTPD